ncbi:MAG: hypothetical protein VX498_02405 [Myxococcota bacterium]|nr:hypothetical protein [Myxococcota bacterium]
MARHGAFVLPTGARVQVDGGDVCIENRGDIFIEGAEGLRFASVISTEGDVVFRPDEPTSLKTIRAPLGRVTVAGRVAVESIIARDLVFRSGTLRVSVIKASGSVNLAGERVEANVVVGKKVQFASGLVGRATAVHSEEELGAHRLKGGFSLAEFVALVPDGATLLSAHDISVPIGGIPLAARDRSLQPAEADDVDEQEEEPQITGTAASHTSSVVGRLNQALHEILGQYRGSELPPSVQRLSEMVDKEDYGSIGTEMHRLWSDLLKHHQKAGQPISNAVSKSFQSIQKAVTELD